MRTDRRKILPIMNHARHSHSSLGISEQIYVFGGENQNGTDLNSIEKFSSATGISWHEIELGECFLPRIEPFVCTLSKSEIIIFGGRFYDKDDPMDDKW